MKMFRPFLAPIIWILWIAFCSWILLFNTQITADLTAFLPRDSNVLNEVLVQQMRDGPGSRLILIGIEGPNKSVLADISRSIQKALSTHPSVRLAENGRNPRLLAALEETLFRYRYLLSSSTTPGAFSEQGLSSALHERNEALASPFGLIDKRWLGRDPTGSWIDILKGWLSHKKPREEEGVWFSKDGSRALMIVESDTSGFNMDVQAPLIQSIHHVFDALNKGGENQLKIGGVGPLSAEVNDLITRDASVLSVANTIMVIALLYGVYRSVRLLFLGFMPLVTALMSGVAMTSLCFGEVHGISLGFGATLLGVAADYPNHFFTHLTNRNDPQKTIRQIWPTLGLGVLTNVAGFTGMYFSGFEGLVQIAVLASSGLMSAAITTRYVIPALTPKISKGTLPFERSNLLAKLPALLNKFRALPLVLSLIVILSFLSSGRPTWNDDIEALNPVPKDKRELTESLQTDLGSPDLRTIILIDRKDAQSAIRMTEKLGSHLESLMHQGVISGFDAVAKYLPSQETQELRQHYLPSKKTLENNLKRAVSRSPFRAETFQPFIEDVELSHNIPFLKQENYIGTPLSLRIENLLFSMGTHWIALIPLRDIQNYDRLAWELMPFKDDGVLLVDLQKESSRVVREYRQEALSLLGGSLVLITLLLRLGLHSFKRAVRVLTPMVLASLCTALIVGLASGGLTLYNLVSLLLVMGLSLDQALFFNRLEGTQEERNKTFLSLIICSISSILAFGTLAFSEVSILKSIGITVSLGAFLAILFSATLAQEPASQKGF